MNATPETFKPGQRWLMAGFNGMAIEVVCVEWAHSGEWVKVLIVSNDKADWIRATELVDQSDAITGGRNLHNRYVIELLERLPDESGNHKTESESRAETPCGECACCRWVIEKQRKEIYEAIEKGGIKYEGERGKTFSVLTSIEAEIEKRKRD